MPRARTQRRTRKRHLIVPIVTGPIAGGSRLSPQLVGASTGTTGDHYTSKDWGMPKPPLGPPVGAADYKDPRTGATGGRRRKSRRRRYSRRR